MDERKKILKITQGLTNILMEFKEKSFEGTKAGDLSMQFFHYINVIDELENPTFSDLAESLNLSKPAITAIVNKLIEEDVVYKSQSVEDRRVYFIHLTEEGKKVSSVYQKGYLDFADYVMNSLNEKELKKFIELSEQIISGGQKKK